MATLPDNAVDLIADDEVERYTVVRVADEIVVDLMKSACGVSYEQAAPHIEARNVAGVAIPVLDKVLAHSNREYGAPERRVGCARVRITSSA